MPRFGICVSVQICLPPLYLFASSVVFPLSNSSVGFRVRRTPRRCLVRLRTSRTFPRGCARSDSVPACLPGPRTHPAGCSRPPMISARVRENARTDRHRYALHRLSECLVEPFPLTLPAVRPWRLMRKKNAPVSVATARRGCLTVPGPGVRLSSSAFACFVRCANSI